MLVVREVFTAKPGQASKLAKLFKKMATGHMRVMTDMVGEYNTVVMEMEVKDLAEFERWMAKEHSKDMPKEVQEELKHFHEMFMTGRREIWRITE